MNQLNKTLLAISILVLLTAKVSFAQDDVTNKLSPTSHPRLFYTAKKISELRQRVKTDKIVRQAWQRQLTYANDLLDEKFVTKGYAEAGAGQHGNYRAPSKQIEQMAGTLGLAWRMTGEKRYAKKLKDALIHFGTFDRWAGDAGHDPPWHSELNTARFCFGYAIGFDSIYDYLS